MDMLRKPWLGSVMREVLAEIVQWRSADLLDKTKNGYHIIGDSVRVKMGRCRALQIVKFLTFDGEIQAWLSDTDRVVNATFSLAVVDAEKSRNGRRFTEGTAGGIIAITDCEIRVQCPADAPPPRLMLYVHQAAFIGSGGEGVFGNPMYIGRDSGINELLATISTLDLSDHELTGYNWEVETSARSQGSNGQSEEVQRKPTSGEEIPNEFATQIGQPQLVASIQESSSGVGAGRHGPVSAMTAVDVSARIKERAKANNLLGILLPEKRAVLGHDSLEKVRPPVAKKPPRDPPTALERESSSAAGREDMRKLILDPASDVAKIDSRAMANVDDEGVDTNAESLEQAGRINKADTRVANLATISREERAGIVTGEVFDSDPWAGMTRIPRREVRIPKDQDDLLSNKNCWIPPEPGNRFPVGNIPVPILRSLVARAERSAFKGRDAAEAAKNHIDVDSCSESGNVSDSDTEVELEWPSSPVRPHYVRTDEMPVDSSPVGASPTYNKPQSGVRPSQKEGVQSRRKHKGTISDNQDSSPTAKRPRKGEFSGKESRLVQREGEGVDMRGQNALRHQNVKSQSPHADRQVVEEEARSSTSENDGHLIEVLDLKSKESNGLRGPNKLASMSTLDSTFSPIDNGTQVSHNIPLYRKANAAHVEAVLEVDHTEIERGIESHNCPGGPEQLEPRVDATAERISRVLNTQDRTSVFGRKTDGSDSEEEHELEVSLPAALGDGLDSIGYDQANLALNPHLPSTAPQPQKSVLQVKQTPCLYGEASKKTFRHNSLVSRTEAGSPGGGTDFSSDPVIPCTFPHTENLVEYQVRTSGKHKQTKDYNVGDFDEDSVLASSQIDTKYRLHSYHRPLANMDNKKESASGDLEAESASRDLVQAGVLKGHDSQEASPVAGDKVATKGEKECNEGGKATGESGGVVHKRDYSETEEDRRDKSRKRFKRFKLPVSFAFSQENRQFLDPSEIARNYRQEFFTNLSRQPSPVLDPSSTPSSGPGGRERSLEDISTNRSTAEIESPLAVALDTRKVDIDTRKESGSRNRVIEDQVIAPVERAAQAFNGNWSRQPGNPDGAKGNGSYREARHSELQIPARYGIEEGHHTEDTLPATEKTTRIVLVESQSTTTQASTPTPVVPPPTPNPAVSGQGAAVADLSRLENTPSTTYLLEGAPAATSIAPRCNNDVSKEGSNGDAGTLRQAAVSVFGTTNPVVTTVKRSPHFRNNAPGKNPWKLPGNDPHRETARLPENSSARNHSGMHADSTSHDFGAEYSSATTPAERLALLRTFTRGTDANFETYTDAQVLETLKNFVTMNQISRQDFARALLQIRKSLSLESLATKLSEPNGSLRPSPKASSSRPSHQRPAVSASVTSNTPLNTLLSSPALMKVKTPSSVLDWLEKTSSVGSESADNVSDPQEQEWWHDRNTPFKEWSRAYVSLKSMKGAMGKVDREKGAIIPPCENMDVLGWSL